MTTANIAIFSEAFRSRPLPIPIPENTLNSRRTRAHRRLTKVFETAEQAPFDDSSRIVFFSDCHRGDKTRADAFTKNDELFFHALTHYYDKGFTYIEVGDGDEMLKNRRFSAIRESYGHIFDLLHRFNRQDRLHLILGNHDIHNGRRDRVEKDGLVAYEGLILHHSETEQRIFVIHGHQADLKSDRFHAAGRFLARYIWKQLQRFVVGSRPSYAGHTKSREKVRRRIVAWQQIYRPIVICGHTHAPMSAPYGAPPYFNTGSCLYANYITGLEIINGEIVLIRWTAQSQAGKNGSPSVKRELVSAPRKLRLFA